MANPEVDRLIQELSQVLNTNREKRSTSEAMVQGMRQGQQLAQTRNEAARQAANHGQKSGVGAAEASMRAGSGNAVTDNERRRSGVAEQYARSVKLEDNAAPYEFLSEREPPAAAQSPADAAILEERKKRMTQNLMLSRGQSGGPLGGAGSEPIDPAVAEALSQAGNPQLPPGAEYPMLPGGRPDPMTAPNPYGSADPMVAPNPYQPQSAAPAGWSPEDYAKLSALSQRYPG